MFQWPGVPVADPLIFGDGAFEALPTPLGSLIELLLPPTLPGPAGTPLTPVVPAPADPAFGVPAEKQGRVAAMYGRPDLFEPGVTMGSEFAAWMAQ